MLLFLSLPFTSRSCDPDLGTLPSTVFIFHLTTGRLPVWLKEQKEKIAVGAYFTVFMPVSVSTVSALLLCLPLLVCFRAAHALLPPSSVALAVSLWGSACLCIVLLSAATSNHVRNQSLISEVWFKVYKWHIKPLAHWLVFISNCGWLLQSPGSSTLSPSPICID